MRDVLELINKMAEEEINTKNFYAWFPGGYKRKLVDKDGSVEKTINDLDRIIEETEFKIETFKSLRGDFFYYQKMGIYASSLDNPPRSKEDAQWFIKLSSEQMKKIQEIIYPIFKAMLELGYKAEDLKR